MRRFLLCPLQRHGLSVGANPARQLSLHLVAIEAVVEATKRLKPLMKKGSVRDQASMQAVM